MIGTYVIQPHPFFDERGHIITTSRRLGKPLPDRTNLKPSVVRYLYKALVTPGIGYGYLPSGPGRAGGTASQA
jgi:hypothetical protein